MRVALGDFLELNLRVRSADDARLQTIFGFWPAFLVAFALRLVGLFKFPFLDEEDRMMRVAVNGLFGYGPQSGQAPFWENLLFRTPLSNSQAITPLWWWTEYVARLVVKDETLSARLPALLTGLIGLALFYWLARQLFPFPIPALLAWLLAVHDVFLWVGTKAQYVESFIFALSVLIAWALLVAQGKWRPFVVAVLASTTAMGFFLLKGMTLTFNALAVGVAQTALLRGGGRRLNFETIVQRAIFAGLIVTPLAVWLLAAQAYITAHYQVRVAELGYFRGIADILYALTFGYGTGRTASLV
ncbi:MAG: hypothetical protein HY260_13615, partial [Chloroflexi bacterium]|nr:hypothetical protein [Chloroflexota bacterium]